MNATSAQTLARAGVAGSAAASHATRAQHDAAAQRGRILGLGGVFFKSLIVSRCANGIRTILNLLIKAKARCFRGANTITRKRTR